MSEWPLSHHSSRRRKMALFARSAWALGMTLAVILLCIFITEAFPSAVASAVQSSPQATPSDKPASSQQDQKGAPESSQTQGSSQTPTTAPAQPIVGQTPAKRPHHKKKAADCVPAASGPSAPASTGATPTDVATTSASGAPVNCPPPKVVVPEGGTKEPSIDLVGGESNQVAYQRDTANKKLNAAESNLKEIAGQKLSANQQALLTQVREFMKQSRSAITAGDLERADTLAGKALQLSEELVKPNQP